MLGVFSLVDMQSLVNVLSWDSFYLVTKMYLFNRRDKLYSNDPVGQVRISIHNCQKINAYVVCKKLSVFKKSFTWLLVKAWSSWWDSHLKIVISSWIFNWFLSTRTQMKECLFPSLCDYFHGRTSINYFHCYTLCIVMVYFHE